VNSISSFFSKSIEEMRTAVTWPTYSELQANSLLVLISSLLFALVIWGIDIVFEQLMRIVYSSAA
jgi:preprotein translocase subunit SecE